MGENENKGVVYSTDDGAMIKSYIELAKEYGIDISDQLPEEYDPDEE